jgi:hypothetical protein
MTRTHRILFAALATIAVGTALLGAAQGPDPKEGWAKVIKWLMSPFTDPNAQEKQYKAAGDKYWADVWSKAERFRKDHQYDLVIANEAGGDWKFGLTDLFPTQLKDSPSGTVKVTMVKSFSLDNEPNSGAVMTTTSAPVNVKGWSGTLVVTPVCEKKNLLSKMFARVFYLEDAKRHRMYFTLTKGTSSTSVPVVGVAEMSNKILYDQKPIEFNDPKAKSFNMLGIKVDALE